MKDFIRRWFPERPKYDESPVPLSSLTELIHPAHLPTVQLLLSSTEEQESKRPPAIKDMTGILVALDPGQSMTIAFDSLQSGRLKKGIGHHITIQRLEDTDVSIYARIGTELVAFLSNGEVVPLSNAVVEDPDSRSFTFQTSSAGSADTTALPLFVTIPVTDGKKPRLEMVIIATRYPPNSLRVGIDTHLRQGKGSMALDANVLEVNDEVATPLEPIEVELPSSLPQPPDKAANVELERERIEFVGEARGFFLYFLGGDHDPKYDQADRYVNIYLQTFFDIISEQFPQLADKEDKIKDALRKAINSLTPDLISAENIENSIKQYLRAYFWPDLEIQFGKVLLDSKVDVTNISLSDVFSSFEDQYNPHMLRFLTDHFQTYPQA